MRTIRRVIFWACAMSQNEISFAVLDNFDYYIVSAEFYDFRLFRLFQLPSTCPRKGVFLNRNFVFAFEFTLRSKDLGVTQAGNLLVSPFLHSALKHDLSINCENIRSTLLHISCCPSTFAISCAQLISECFFFGFVTRASHLLS